MSQFERDDIAVPSRLSAPRGNWEGVRVDTDIYYVRRHLSRVRGTNKVGVSGSYAMAEMM